jgi:hypothetical protein
MKNELRACANCASYNPEPEGDETTCWNGITFTDRPGTPTERTREPVATDTCPDHKSHCEDAREDMFIEAELRAGGPAAASAAADACAVAHVAIRRAARV